MKSFNFGQLGHAGHIPDMSVLSAGHNQRDADKTGDHPPLGGCPLCPPLMPPKNPCLTSRRKYPSDNYGSFRVGVCCGAHRPRPFTPVEKIQIGVLPCL